MDRIPLEDIADAENQRLSAIEEALSLQQLESLLLMEIGLIPVEISGGNRRLTHASLLRFHLAILLLN